MNLSNFKPYLGQKVKKISTPKKHIQNVKNGPKTCYIGLKGHQIPKKWFSGQKMTIFSDF